MDRIGGLFSGIGALKAALYPRRFWKRPALLLRDGFPVADDEVLEAKLACRSQYFFRRCFSLFECLSAGAHCGVEPNFR